MYTYIHIHCIWHIYCDATKHPSAAHSLTCPAAGWGREFEKQNLEDNHGSK